MALCAYLHALRWRADGGAAGALRETMRQDVIDMTYAAYALCFDGLFTKDKLPKEIYEDAKPLLQLFAKHAPKPPRRRAQGAACQIASNSDPPFACKDDPTSVRECFACDGAETGGAEP